MELLACGHLAYPGPIRMCAHLLVPEDQDEKDHVRVLRGRGLEYDLRCLECDRSGAEVRPVQVCEGCMDRYDDPELRSSVAWRGIPGIGERPEPVSTAVAGVRLPRRLHDPLDWGPAGGDGSVWLFLTRRGELVRFDADSGEHETVVRKALSRESKDARPRLHASADGRYAAVVNDHGSRGAVFEQGSGRRCLALDGGAERAHAVPFALAFTEFEGRTVLVHRTGGHRLDVSDPATGELLTDRRIPREEGDRPSAYHHGALYVSPDGRWIADHGWVWGPQARLTVWDLHHWLRDNPWEPEDGPSRRELYSRFHCLNEPVCWISDELVALSGVGYNDDDLLDGVQVFDALTGAETGSFAGPRRPLLADHRRLYSSGVAGLEIWDPFTGERTGTVPGFFPHRHHPAAAELAAVQNGMLRRWATR